MYGQGQGQGSWRPDANQQFQNGPPMQGGQPFDGVGGMGSMDGMMGGEGGQPWQQQQFGGPGLMQEQPSYGHQLPMEAQQGYRQGYQGGMAPTQPQQWGQGPPAGSQPMPNPNPAGNPQWQGPNNPGAGPWEPEFENAYQGNPNVGIPNMGGREPMGFGQGIPQQHGNPYQQSSAAAPWQQSGQSQGFNPMEGRGPMQQQQLPQMGGPSPNPYAQPEPSLPQQSGLVSEPRVWVGKVTQLIPPNYGIIDGDSFYVTPVVVGRVPQVGEPVRVEAIPNTDGGRYAWRCVRVEAVGAETHGLRGPSPAHMGASPAHTPQQVAPTQRLPAQGQTGGFKIPAKQPIVRVPQIVKSSSRGDFPAQPPLPPSSKESPSGDAGKGDERPGVPKYNQMAPPTNQYTAEIATAIAQNAVDGFKTVNPQVFEAAAKRSSVFGSGLSKAQLDEEARRRSEEALKSLATYGDSGGVGIKMLANMGFGAAGVGLGRNEQGISAPVEAKELMQGAGLGFSQRRKSPPRERRRPPPRRRSRGRSPSVSRSRSRSPRGRSSGAYRCDPPKFPPFEASRGIPALSKRYKNLYIPSDFCRLYGRWVESLPDHRPLPLTRAFSFKLGKMEDDEIAKVTTDHSVGSALPEEDIATARFWSAKVVLMSGMPEGVLHAADAKGFQHPARKLQFLIGRRGKNELMPIGGAWEPCDGCHPESDPSALIRTATRTFKEATGLDLSLCPSWHKFAEYSYLRAADKKKGVPEHLEKSIVFLVEGGPLAKPDDAAADSLAKAKSAEAEEDAAKAALEAAEEAAKAAEKAAEEAGSKEQPTAVGEDETLETANLTVAQLQEELTKRSLDTKWNPLKGKKELIERLQEWLDAKKKARESQEQEYNAAQAKKRAAEEAVQAEREAREAYKVAKAFTKTSAKLLLDPPPLEAVEVRVNKEFLCKKERFTVLPMTLEGLLEYTEDDKKELTFEVSTLGELLHDMLDTRFGRALLRGLAVVEHKMEEARAKKAAEKAAEKAAKEAEKEAAKAAKKAEEDAAAKVAEGDEASKEGQEAGAGDVAANGDTAMAESEARVVPAESRGEDAKPGAIAESVAKPAANGKADEEMPDIPAEDAAAKEAQSKPPAEDATTADDKEDTKAAKKPRKQTAAQRKKAEAAAKKDAKEKETKQKEDAEVKEAAKGGVAAESAAKGSAAKETAEIGASEINKDRSAATQKEEAAAAQVPLVASIPEPAAEAAEKVEPSSSKKRTAEEDAEPSGSKRQRTDADWGIGAVESGEPLSVACRWFDRECKGYIRDEDLEEIAFMVSEGISRKRVQTLVDNVTRSRVFSYGDYASLAVPAALPPIDQPVAVLSGISTAAGSERGVGTDIAAMERTMVALDASRKEADARHAELAKELDAMRKAQHKLLERKEELEKLVAKQGPELENAAALKNTSKAAVAKASAELDAAHGAIQRLQVELTALTQAFNTSSSNTS